MLPHLRNEQLVYIKALLLFCLASTLFVKFYPINNTCTCSPQDTAEESERQSPVTQIETPPELSEDGSMDSSTLCNSTECARKSKAAETLVAEEFVPEHPPLTYDMKSNLTARPWKDDARCKMHLVRLGQNTPEVTLASYPRSGNSWVRYLMEGATGVFTGSIYRDPRLFDLGYLGEMQDPEARTVLLIKNHHYRPRIMNDLRPAVFIIRNPRDVLTSFHAFKNGAMLQAFNFVAASQYFQDEVFHRELPNRLVVWERMATLIVQKCKYIHVVYYENMKQNPLYEISKILKFMRIPEDNERMECLARHMEGKVNRGQPKYNPYTAQEKKLISEAVERVSTVLQQRGYAPLPYVEE